MACVLSVKDFPSLGCLIEDGNLNTKERKSKYLGGEVSPFENGKMTVNLLLQTDEEMRVFAEWWVNSLDYGTSPFKITLPFFATDMEYTVFMTNSLIERGLTGEMRKIPLELKQVF